MEQIREFFRWETRSGTPITVGDTILIPRSQALSVRLPFGGFVWNRPLSVLVERKGQTDEIPIVDVTRIALLSITASGFVLTLLAWIWRLGRRKRRS
jgi:hypothetical protein